MAVDTKPNLSNSKFEQCVGDTLTLSGITNVHGTFSVRSGATLSILPNRGAGKILTSDASGNGTWQINNSVNGAGNGLTLEGNKIILGGTLTGSTNIGLSTSTLNFCTTNSTYCFNDLCSELIASSNVGVKINGNGIDDVICLTSYDKCIDISHCLDSVNLWAGTVNPSFLKVGSGIINLKASGFTCIDLCGAVDCILITSANAASYAGDYSSVFDSVPRSIPDAAWVLSKTSSSSSGERITKLINQPSHGFTVGTVVGWSGGTYNKPIADGLYDGEVLGIVSKCYNANCFDLTQAGYVTGLTSLTANTTYFLSDSTAGLLTCLEPTINGCIAKTMLIADSTTSAWVLPYAGYVVTTGSSGGGTVTGALNGLTLSGSDIILGGTLTGNTVVCRNGNDISIGGVNGNESSVLVSDNYVYLIATNTNYVEVDSTICNVCVRAGTASLNVCGASGSEDAKLYANTNSYLNIYGVSGSEYACLQANTNSYLDIGGVSGVEYIVLNANDNSFLNIGGTSSSEYANLYSNFAGNTFLNLGGLGGFQSACLSASPNTYLMLQNDNEAALCVNGAGLNLYNDGLGTSNAYLKANNISALYIEGTTGAECVGLNITTNSYLTICGVSAVECAVLNLTTNSYLNINGVSGSECVWLHANPTSFLDINGAGGSEEVCLKANTSTFLVINGISNGEYTCLQANANSYLDISGAAGFEKINLISSPTSCLYICGVSNTEFLTLQSNANSYLSICGASGSEYACLQANTASFLNMCGVSGVEYACLQANTVSYLNIVGVSGVECAFLHANNITYLDISGNNGLDRIDLVSNQTNGVLLNLGGIGGCQSACLQANTNSYLSICGVSSIEDVCLKANTDSYLYIGGVSGSETVQLQSNANSYLSICGASGSEYACLHANATSYLNINGVSSSETVQLQASGNTYLSLDAAIDTANLHANATSYLDIDGTSFKNACLQANTNSYLNIHGESANEFACLQSKANSYLSLYGASSGATLSAAANTYLSFDGQSGNQCLRLQPNTGSCLEICSTSSCKCVSLQASPTAFLHIDGTTGDESFCVYSNANYIQIGKENSNNYICLETCVGAGAALRLSGYTVGICGQFVKLFTTPVTGVCTDSVLTWNATDNTIKILPYSSGGTGGSSLSEFTITGNSSATGFTVNHAKNKQFVGVEVVKNSSPYPTVYTNVYRTNANCVCVTFDTAPTTGLEYKILITS